VTYYETKPRKPQKSIAKMRDCTMTFGGSDFCDDFDPIDAVLANFVAEVYDSLAKKEGDRFSFDDEPEGPRRFSS
jgi:hypothetical protein